MASRHTRKTRSLVNQATELAFAVPQVVAHRITRMAIAGPTLSERDRKEFQRMGAEKTAAFNESWNAMAVHAVRAQQALATSLVRSMWSPALSGKPPAVALVSQLQAAALNVLGKGMSPVHRTAVANARRLARTKLR